MQSATELKFDPDRQAEVISAPEPQTRVSANAVNRNLLRHIDAPVIVVGAGSAGMRVVDHLINGGIPRSKVLQFGGEPYAPYNRVKLSSLLASCHNEHKDTPRTDFKIGDVKGGVVIRIPLEK